MQFTLDDIYEQASVLGNLARREHRFRRLRETYLGPGLFGEPAWDILLYLFADTINGKELRVSSACIVAHCPPTTALRYIERLKKGGFIERRPSETDGRVYLLRLTPTAILGVGSYLMILAGFGNADNAFSPSVAGIT